MRQIARGSTPFPTKPAVPLAWITLALAAVSAAVGLFVPNLYRDAEGWIRQARAADLVTLFAVVPTLGLALCRARASSRAGWMVAMGAVGYLVYNYAIFGFSVAINPMTPVHLAILGLSIWTLLFSMMDRVHDASAAPLRLLVPRRTTAAFLVSIGALFGLLWLGQIAQAITSGVAPEELARLGLPTNPVYALDLAVALPFVIIAGLVLLRRPSVGQELALAALAWVVLMAVGVLAIFAFDAAAGAAIAVPVVVMIGSVTVVGIGLTGLSLRSPDAARPSQELKLHPEAEA